jgi:hypothetical protein
MLAIPVYLSERRIILHESPARRSRVCGIQAMVRLPAAAPAHSACFVAQRFHFATIVPWLLSDAVHPLSPLSNPRPTVVTGGANPEIRLTTGMLSVPVRLAAARQLWQSHPARL